MCSGMLRSNTNNLIPFVTTPITTPTVTTPLHQSLTLESKVTRVQRCTSVSSTMTRIASAGSNHASTHTAAAVATVPTLLSTADATPHHQQQQHLHKSPQQHQNLPLKSDLLQTPGTDGVPARNSQPKITPQAGSHPQSQNRTFSSTTKPTSTNIQDTPKCLSKPLHDVYELAAKHKSSPINIERFIVYLHGYDSISKHKLIYSLKHGIRIPSKLVVDQDDPVPKNHSSINQHLDFVRSKLQEESSKHRIAGPFQVKPPGLVVSPLSVVDKKQPGSFRLVHDLSFKRPGSGSVNSTTPRDFCSVHYETLDHCIQIISRMGRHSLCAKADIESAFRNLQVSKYHYRLLGMHFDNAYWFDTCLPFGSSVSCCAFEEFACAIQWVLTNKFGVKNMSHILDDFLFFSPAQSNQCHLALSSFLAFASSVGIPVKASKTVQPTTQLELHGVQVSTDSMQLSLPPDKLEKAFKTIQELEQLKKATVGQIQSALGFLNFCLKIVPAGRPFLRRLYDCISGDKPKWHFVRITAEIRQDLSVWKQFLTHFNGRCIISPYVWGHSYQFHIYSDSSKMGLAGVFKNRWFYGCFPPHWLKKNIAIKECVSVYLAFHLWHREFQDSSVLFHIDNESVVYNLRNQTSHLPEIVSMIRSIVLLAMRFNIRFYSVHIPGFKNRTADLLSRFQFQKARQHAPHLDLQPTQYPLHLLPWRTQQ